MCDVHTWLGLHLGWGTTLRRNQVHELFKQCGCQIVLLAAKIIMCSHFGPSWRAQRIAWQHVFSHTYTHTCACITPRGRRTVLLNCSTWSSQRYRVQYFCICTSRRFSQNCSDWIVFSCSAAVDVCVSPDWTEGEEGKMRKSRSVLTVSPNNVSHPAPLIFTHKKITTSCLLARVFKQKRCYITRELDPGEAPHMSQTLSLFIVPET